MTAKPLAGESVRPGDSDAIGYKTDAGKLRFGLIPVDGLTELAKVFNLGDSKYPPQNWRRGILWSRVYDAILRHIFAWANGESRDPETGCHHLGSAIWNCMVLINYEITHPGNNDIYMPLKNNLKEACEIANKNKPK